MFNVGRSMFNVRQMSAPLSRKNLPENPTPDEILNAFLDYLTATGTEPYDHQEEAILELFAGNNVILNTPTGSGKSLVALALQFKSLCQGRRSYYTVPIKALANEKFLSLCQVLGPENVGMITGDATVNHDAPVICCTAEILANMALRDGDHSPVDDVIMDEFHYYSDHSRGAARDLLSTNFCTKEEKLAIARALDDADFRSPYGRELSKILRHGVGIHHAGLLHPSSELTAPPPALLETLRRCH